eukprot:2903215-Alexandrium_andersonii.AAC.1
MPDMSAKWASERTGGASRGSGRAETSGRHGTAILVVVSIWGSWSALADPARNAHLALMRKPHFANTC